jgi:hypothetical protein
MRYALIYIIASQLVSLQDVFHLAVQFSKYKSGFRSFGLLSLPSALRSLKTIQVQEEEQSFACSIDRNFLPCWLLLFLRICYAPNRLSSVSTWCQA